jgi:GT2 family glycosyltransferase/glycosyltransferase involved in cell wall biosynthesis
MISTLKKKLKNDLSPASKFWAKGLFVGAVRSVVRAAAFGYRLTLGLRERAVGHGLDWHRAWDVHAKLGATQIPAFGFRDLLYLRDRLAKRADETAEIRTSIIIPVFNNVEFTFQCLRSLLNEVDLSTTEIIVADDASTDETPELLELYGQHIRVVTNAENLGFGGACNVGAGAARGRYLVFLNNDTWVLPGWLAELERTAQDDESVGAVGSMFLYPDGRIQEAGGIIWRSGGACHYGWGRSSDDRRFNFAREVDYCSAASLLIRKDLYDRLGGFDPLFYPAYHEDTDLCMGVRSLGHKVIYQPASRLIHFEGAALGTDVNSGLKRFQAANQKKLRDKWREVLERDHLPEARSRTGDASDRRGISVLVVDDRLPLPDRDAGSARMFAVLKSLAAWCRPVFVAVNRDISPKYEQPLWRIGVETSLAAEIPRLLKERQFSVAILTRPEVAEAVMHVIRRRDPRIKIVFDFVDVHFVRVGREFGVTKDPKALESEARYRSIETRIARRADHLWFAANEDQKTVTAIVPERSSVVIPTVHELRPSAKAFSEREGLFFLGNMLHRPNLDSILYILKEIMPLVRRELPDVKLFVAGMGATAEVEEFDSATTQILGHVPDIEPYFSDCRLMIAPLRFGAGIKGKIGESLAHGLPVVTTPIGAESMGIRNEVEAMIADTPEELAAAVVHVYREAALWQRLSENGLRLISENYTPAVIEKRINSSIRDLIGQ